MKEIWLACDDIGYPFGPLTQFLMLTGQRRGEVANMRREDINWEEKTWTMPKEKTKSHRQHIVSLSETALEILKSVPNLGEYFFSSSGERGFENFSRGKKEIDKTIKNKRKKKEKHPLPSLAAWTILNHSSGTIRGVAAIYNRHHYFDEQKEALESWSKKVQKILEAEYTSKSYIRVI
jgi:integrase